MQRKIWVVLWLILAECACGSKRALDDDLGTSQYELTCSISNPICWTTAGGTRCSCPSHSSCQYYGAPNNSSKACLCNAGWHYDGVSACVSDCLTNNGGCGTNATCGNDATTGLVSCTCDMGYTKINGICTSICDVPSMNPCGPNGGCMVNPGGLVTCYCLPGYAGMPCADIDECDANHPTTCNRNLAYGRCTNSPAGSYTCTCNPGFQLSGNGTSATCVDVPECTNGSDPCQIGAGHATRCIEVTGSYSCECATGYESSTVGGRLTCTDIDGCANHPCFAGVSCADVPAPGTGFTCGLCPSGYSGNGITCSDVDECQANNGGCDANATCANTPGSRTCTCKPGWSGNGISCTDVDECQTNNGGCDANATCANMPGSRTCTCKPGWTGTGLSCCDVDECLTNNGGCGANALCENSLGSFHCTCLSGYMRVGDNCEPDADGDGIPEKGYLTSCSVWPPLVGSSPSNCNDNCPLVANAGQEDWNADGSGDACSDADGDGILDSVDNCRTVANCDQADMDTDGIGDACDIDDDNDGICNPGKAGPGCVGSDNCPLIANQNQKDSDFDGVGDACDNCPLDWNPDQADSDLDLRGDICDTDRDGDGIPEYGFAVTCSGGAVQGCRDNCPDDKNPDQADLDNDGIGDICDYDADGDGVPDSLEQKIGSNPRAKDSDNDGILDGDELALGLDPTKSDTDGDGVLDADEIGLPLAARGLPLPEGYTPKDDNNDGVNNARQPGGDASSQQSAAPSGLWLVTLNGSLEKREDFSGFTTTTCGTQLDKHETTIADVNGLRALVLIRNDPGLGLVADFVKIAGPVADTEVSYSRCTFQDGRTRIADECNPNGCLLKSAREISCKGRGLQAVRDTEIFFTSSRPDSDVSNHWILGAGPMKPALREIAVAIKDLQICGTQGSAITPPVSGMNGFPDGYYFNVPRALLAAGRPFKHSSVKKRSYVSGAGRATTTAVSTAIGSWEPVRIDTPKDVVRDGKSADSQLTFSLDSPGVLRVSMKAKATDGMPAHVFQYIDEHLQWELDPVGDSHSVAAGAKWVALDVSPNWQAQLCSADDALRGKGGMTSAVVGTYTGLPRNNNDFGNKTVVLSLRDEHGSAVEIDRKIFQVFFPKFGNNHPCSRNVPEDSPVPAITPNWFCYWPQLHRPATANYYHELQAEARNWVGNCAHGAFFVPRPSWEFGGSDPMIVLCDAAASNATINDCLALIEHENTHSRFWNEQWPTNGESFNKAQTTDLDWFRDSWEIANPVKICDRGGNLGSLFFYFHPGVNDDTVSPYEADSYMECSAYAQQRAWLASHDFSSQDWADPGSQDEWKVLP